LHVYVTTEAVACKLQLTCLAKDLPTLPTLPVVSTHGRHKLTPLCPRIDF
jgi:hypothetical protein